jgi:tetratricopeptide (TPR) repeat protein
MKKSLHLLVYFILMLFLSFCGRQGKNPPEQSSTAPATALKVLTEKIQHDSSDAGLFHRRAQLYLDEGQINNALGDINKAIQLDAENAGYFITLADIYLAMGKIPGSLESLQKAEKLDPKNNDALIKQAELYLVIKDYPKCFNYVNAALALNRQNPVAYFIWGYAQLERGDTTSAIRNLQTAADQDQNYYDAFLQLGMVYAARKNPVAEDYFRSAIRIDSTRTGAYYLMGLLYQETGEYTKALDIYEKLARVSPAMKEAHYNMGYVNLVSLGNYPAAIQHFTEAIRLDPKYTDAYFNRGYSYELSGDLMNAKKDYEQALQVQPNYDRAIEGLNRLDKQTK